jgi:hypothetical protein
MFLSQDLVLDSSRVYNSNTLKVKFVVFSKPILLSGGTSHFDDCNPPAVAEMWRIGELVLR